MEDNKHEYVPVESSRPASNGVKHKLTIALLLAACAFIISLVFNPVGLEEKPGSEQAQSREVVETGPTVTLAGETIRVDIVDSSAERERGLSGRAGLDLNEGMLFIFPTSGVYSFWMKDMLFSIDILWISNSGEIIDIRESVTPESYPNVFTPRGEARYVLELPAGWAARHDVTIGDQAQL